MQSTTSTARLGINTVSVQNAVDDSGQVIITIGPNGGPFQSVYLNPLQAVGVAAAVVHATTEANSGDMKKAMVIFDHNIL